MSTRWMKRAVAGAALACAGVASIACGPLVGGECLPGYVVDGAACVPAPALAPEGGGGTGGGTGGGDVGGSGATGGVGAGGGVGGEGASGGQGNSGGSAGAGGGGGSVVGGSGGGGPGCEPPLVDCGSGCVDLMTDPLHCGSCGNGCATELCIDGECTGDPVGHAVVIGMDYQQSSAPARILLGNAVFLTAADPVRILDFRKWSQPASAAGVDAAVAEQGTLRNRTYTTVSVAATGALLARLDPTKVNVLLLHDQPGAPAGELGSFGADLAAPLADFLAGGGVAVALATGGGSGEMTDLLESSGLLATSAAVDVTGTSLFNLAPGNVIGVGVAAPFLAKPVTSVFEDAEPATGLLSYVLVNAAALPVAVHRVVLP